MTAPPQRRPTYRISYCSRHESDRAATLPAEVRDLFASNELAEFETLPERRRKDRLAGRLAAKRALAAHFIEEYGWNANPWELAIANASDGRPVVRLPWDAPAPAPAFSIAHCSDGAAAAVSTPGQFVGVDLELIETVPAEAVAFVCDPTIALPTDPEALARLWTGKEAALKLLGLGLNADARDVREQDGDIYYSGRPAAAWREMGAPRVRATFQRAGAALLAVAYTGE